MARLPASRFALTLLSIPICLGWSSCFRESATVAGGGTSSSMADQLKIGFDSFQNVKKADWITDSTGTLYTPNPKFAFVGTCLRGISAVAVYLDSVYTGAYKCNFNQTFTWSSANPQADGSHVFRIAPVDRSNHELSSPTVSQTVMLDTVVPAAPVITAPSTTVNNAPFTVSGTVSSTNTYAIVLGDRTGTGLSYSYPGFSVTYNMSPGETRTLTFYAKSRAGLVSAPASITITYLVLQYLRLANFNSASNTAPVAAGDGSTLMMSAEPLILSNGMATASDGTGLRTGILKVGN